MTTGKIFQLIPKIMGEIGAIEKGRTNSSQGYKFRGIEDAYFALQPLLAKYGVFYAPCVLSETREEKPTKNGGMMMTTLLKMQFRFYAAEDGSYFDVVTVGEAMDSGDKSANKAMSTALKYACFQLFCIPTEEAKDDDTENHSHERAQYHHGAPSAPIPLAKASAPAAPAKAPQPFNSEELAELSLKVFPVVPQVSFHGKTFGELGPEKVMEIVAGQHKYIKEKGFSGPTKAWAEAFAWADRYLELSMLQGA